MESNFKVNLFIENLPKANHYLLFLSLLILEGQTNWKLLTPLYILITHLLLAVPIPPLHLMEESISITRQSHKSSKAKKPLLKLPNLNQWAGLATKESASEFLTRAKHYFQAMGCLKMTCLIPYKIS